MKHLVLGSEGQIGTHVTNYLKKKGEGVTHFDIVRTEDEDLRKYNNKLLLKEVGNCDIVHFLAFDVGGSKYMEKYQDSYDFISNNVKIMNNVFDVLKSYKKPFIFASSQMSNMNHSVYGRLKSIGESYTKALNGLIVKFWNVYGYETDPEKSHVITDFIKKAKETGKIEMRTSGQEERQFLYGDDCAECLYILSKKYKEIPRDKHLHITSFEWTKIIDLAKIISKYFDGCEIIPDLNQKDNIQKGIKNLPSDYILRIWQPKTGINEGINKIIKMME